VVNPAPGWQASLMAAQEIRAFAFECDFADGLTYETEFTDDGDHVWRMGPEPVRGTGRPACRGLAQPPAVRYA
jgi:hypothetical protein